MDRLKATQKRFMGGKKIAEIISLLSIEAILSVVKGVLSLSNAGGPHKLVMLIVMF
jgi:hypothetical protein